jgi:hypothetical protein
MQFVKELGADRVLDSQQDVWAMLEQERGGGGNKGGSKGFDLVLDCEGGADPWLQAHRVLVSSSSGNTAGVFVSTADEEVVDRLTFVELLLLWLKGARRKLRAMLGRDVGYHRHHHLLHQWSTLWHLFRAGSTSQSGGWVNSWQQGHSFRADLEALKKMVEEGWVKPVVDRTFRGLGEAVEAMEYTRYGAKESHSRAEVLGKVVLQILVPGVQSGDGGGGGGEGDGRGVGAGGGGGKGGVKGGGDADHGKIKRPSQRSRQGGEKKQGAATASASAAKTKKKDTKKDAFAPHTPVSKWLAHHRLGHHVGQFHELGVQLVEDLQDLDIAMIKGIAGLKPAEEKRLLRALKGHTTGLSRAGL